MGGGRGGGGRVDGARERERLVRDLPFRFSQRNRRYGRIYLSVCVCVCVSLPFPLSFSASLSLPGSLSDSLSLCSL